MAWFDYIMPTSTGNLDMFMSPLMDVTNKLSGDQVQVWGASYPDHVYVVWIIELNPNSYLLPHKSLNTSLDK